MSWDSGWSDINTDVDSKNRNQWANQPNNDWNNMPHGYDQNSEYNQQQNTGYNQQNSGYTQQNSGYTQQNSGYNPQNSGFNQHNTGFNQQDSGYNPYVKTNDFNNQYQQNTGGGNYFDPQKLVNDPMMNLAGDYANQFATEQKQKLSKLVSVGSLKYFFQVDNAYVGKKLGLLLFPFAHKNWSISGGNGESREPVPPRLDVNAPDLYIPLMATITYVLVAAFLMGTQGRFTPEQLGMMTSNAIAWIVCENIVVMITKYIMNISDALSVWHSLALSAYKFFGMIVALLLYIFVGTSAYFMGLAYSAFAITFFLVRSVKAFVLNLEGGGGKKRKLYLLLYISLSQPFVMWWLTSSITNYNSPHGITNDHAWFMNNKAMTDKDIMDALEMEHKMKQQPGGFQPPANGGFQQQNQQQQGGFQPPVNQQQIPQAGNQQPNQQQFQPGNQQQQGFQQPNQQQQNAQQFQQQQQGNQQPNQQQQQINNHQFQPPPQEIRHPPPQGNPSLAG